MRINCLLTVFLALINAISFGQDLNKDKLDELFNSLEKRNEAMGSITISKNGKVLYNRAIGHRLLSDNLKIPADLETNYKIWSITKTYTSVMILQLMEEGMLSLDTTLDQFYPQIPNANSITIKHMLNHRSGIHDFTQNDPDDDWNTQMKEFPTHEFMVRNISKYKPDFPPNEDWRYSNSNYLLLGYIIEKIDGQLYEESLSKRISSRIGLLSTHFSYYGLNNLENKAFSYQFENEWKEFDEGGFSGRIPAGAGGIVSTTTDMARFMEGVFSLKLISEKSLNQMLAGEDSYRLGIMKTHFENHEGFGHTGGYIASESSLFYYPKDSLTIAYCTNGINFPKVEILNYVLKIYHKQPFAVSMNRMTLGLIILCIGLLFFVGFYSKLKDIPTNQTILVLGFTITSLFWLGVLISGFLSGNYNHLRGPITVLDFFYSNSGTFMASVQLIISILLVPFLLGLYKVSKSKKFNFIPILPIIFIAISMAGTSLFPLPNKLHPFFANIILASALGPLLAIILWRKKEQLKIRLHSGVSLLPMLIAIGLFISRPSIPEFVSNYFGLIQRLLYLGLTFWLVSLSLSFFKSRLTLKVERE